MRDHSTPELRAPRAREGEVGDAPLALMVVVSPIREALGTRLEVPPDAPQVIQRIANSETDDAWMSREHATVARGDGGIVVRDGVTDENGWRASANGTFVMLAGARAEDRVTAAATVPIGSLIRTGETLWAVVNTPPQAHDASLLVGASEATTVARDELQLLSQEVALRLAAKRRVTQSLLVTGQRGTGKQVVAREAHRLLAALRQSHDVPFVDLLAPALADGTSAADLFGVVDRYATDVRARPGYFERAHGGVVFIDEVADLPLGEQSKFLNLLEERKVTRLGAKRPFAFEALVVAATNQDLAALVEAGSFRADLLDRLARYRVHLPTLDARREDILPLAQALLKRHAYTGTLNWEVALALWRRSWPGSVRQLDAFIERLAAVARAEGSRDIQPQHVARVARTTDIVAQDQRQPPATTTPPEAGRPSRDALLAQLDAAHWNKAAVARHYGKHPRQITRWMAYLDIERPESE